MQSDTFVASVRQNHADGSRQNDGEKQVKRRSNGARGERESVHVNVTSGATASSGREAAVRLQRRIVKKQKEGEKGRMEVVQLKVSDERIRKKTGVRKREEMRR